MASVHSVNVAFLCKDAISLFVNNLNLVFKRFRHELRKTTVGFVMFVLLCVRMSVGLSVLNHSALPGHIFMNFDKRVFRKTVK